MLQVKSLQDKYQKLAQVRKNSSDKGAQRQLADQIISELKRDITPSALGNAFINNNIQSKSEALSILRGKIDGLKNLNNQNKKTAHDIKKLRSEVKQVQPIPNQWLNFTGNGKVKPMNVKMLLKAIQELEEYAN